MREEGAVVGLPLYILIAVVVAAVALAAILSFMVTSGPSITNWTIEIEKNGGYVQEKVINATVQSSGIATWSGNVKITVYDQNGHPLPNVKVVLDGCSVIAAGQTNAQGVAVIHVTNATLPGGVQEGQIKVTLQYPGLIGQQTKSDSITVIRSA